MKASPSAMGSSIRCDAHVHVFEPARFGYSAQRRFTPGTATARQLADHLAHLEMGHVVLVQPSVYGSDHRALLDALAQLGAREGRARAVVVLDDDITLKDLPMLDARGARGARINLAVDHCLEVESARRRIVRLDRLLPAHWHIQLHAHLTTLQALLPWLGLLRRTFVLDHFGLPQLAQGPGDPTWQALLQAMDSGHIYVKASAPYLLAPEPYIGVQAHLQSLLQTHPDRVVWGSNWPHTQGTARPAHQPQDQPEPFRAINDRQWAEQCATWAGPAAPLCLGINAAQLYELG